MSNEPQRRESATGSLRRSDLSLDVAFDVLADGRRRAVLSYLLGGGRADLEDLAAHVHDPEAADPEKVAVTLHHHHLPKLADVGLISYDSDSRTAVAHDTIRDLEPYLEWARRRD